VYLVETGDLEMGITVTLSSDELAQIRKITQTESDSEAISRAAREFLRISQLRQLKAISGRVAYEDKSHQLEALEISEVDFPE
jgi:uncharacterized protein YhdP